jgi:hypothetical protein
MSLSGLTRTAQHGHMPQLSAPKRLSAPNKPSALNWQDHLTLTRDLVTPGERSAFFTRARKREFIAVFRGVYVRADLWNAMGPDERYRARVKAAAALADRDLVFAYQSAAAQWRLPWVGGWPHQAHILENAATGGRSKAMLLRHTVGIPADLVEIDGLTVTSLARTVVDLARSASFGPAVAVADAALHRTAHPLAGVPRTFLTRDDLLRELDGVPFRHGLAKGHRVIDFADGAADRPGESMSRVNMHLMGLPRPQLQVPIVGDSGRIWIVDFWWPEFNLIGEFDGHRKYTDPEFLRGRTPEQAVIDEKDREDDLRAAHHGMSRWDWDIALSPILLRDKLIRAGLR